MSRCLQVFQESDPDLNPKQSLTLSVAALLHVRQGRKRFVRFRLIPVGNRGDILGQGPIIVIAQTQGLDLYADIAAKADVILNMPAIQAVFTRRVMRIELR